jgi:hypothetical protein
MASPIALDHLSVLSTAEIAGAIEQQGWDASSFRSNGVDGKLIAKHIIADSLDALLADLGIARGAARAELRSMLLDARLSRRDQPTTMCATDKGVPRQETPDTVMEELAPSPVDAGKWTPAADYPLAMNDWSEC